MLMGCEDIDLSTSLQYADKLEIVLHEVRMVFDNISYDEHVSDYCDVICKKMRNKGKGETRMFGEIRSNYAVSCSKLRRLLTKNFY